MVLLYEVVSNLDESRHVCPRTAGVAGTPRRLDEMTFVCELHLLGSLGGGLGVSKPGSQSVRETFHISDHRARWNLENCTGTYVTPHRKISGVGLWIISWS
jgi:hypothetical protein